MVRHKHYPNLGSDTSTMQNSCASSSGVISPGQPVVGYLHPLVFGMQMKLLPSLPYIYSSVFTYLQFARSKFEQIHFFVHWPDGGAVGRTASAVVLLSSEIMRCSTLGLQPSFRSHLTLALDLLWLKRKIRDCSQSIRSMDPPLVIQRPLPLIPYENWLISFLCICIYVTASNQETRQREVVLHSSELRALGEKVKLCKFLVKRPRKDWGEGRGRECSQFNQETKLCKDDW